MKIIEIFHVVQKMAGILQITGTEVHNTLSLYIKKFSQSLHGREYSTDNRSTLLNWLLMHFWYHIEVWEV